MEWSKAKNVILILLVVINIILLVLNMYKIQSNTVSNERINNITNICKKNNISINCNLPKDINSTAQLNIKQYNYDYVKLQQIFFGSITNVKRTNDLTNVIFTRDDERLIVENAKAIFSCKKKDYSGYVQGIKDLLGEFDVERQMGNMIYYYQTYKGVPVFSNYICVDLSGKDRMIITLNYCEILRTIGGRQNIIGSDEALYSAINRISSEIEGDIKISLVEKGYYDSRTVLSKDGAIPPVYAVYVNNRVYFVNAYTGSCYK
jgi:hypothetical protein